MSYKQRTSQDGILFTETSPLAVDGDKDTCTKVLAQNPFVKWLGGVYLWVKPTTLQKLT